MTLPLPAHKPHKSQATEHPAAPYDRAAALTQLRACPGEVVEVNTSLNDDPALVNSAAEGDGWMTKVVQP